jgi:hypothetical protein
MSTSHTVARARPDALGPDHALAHAFPATWRTGALLLLVALICLPLQLYAGDSVSISLADVAMVLALPFLVAIFGEYESRLFLLSITLALAALLSVAIFVEGYVSIRPFLSFSYFFKPYILLFAGYYLVRTGNDFVSLVSMIATTMSVTAILLMFGALQTSGPIRDESSLNLKLFGMDLFGTDGVNSFAVFIATAAALNVIVLTSGRSLFTPATLVRVPGTLALVYIVALSGSRQAISGMIFFVILLSAIKATKNWRIALFTLVVVVIGVGVVWATSREALESAWEFKLNRDAEAISDDQWDVFSAKRLTLYLMEIGDLARNPLCGSGFHGFQLYGRERLGFLDLVGMSPHNQLIGAFWKMGVVAGGAYLLLMWRIHRDAYKLHRDYPTIPEGSGLWALAVTYVVIFCMIQDAYLFPVTGALMMLLLGAAGAVVRKTNTVVVVRGDDAPGSPISQ